MSSRFERAAVLGGSIAGLIAARVLADHFREVVVVERDPHPAGPDPRKGAPQMRHLHAVLEPSVKALRALLPGLVEELAGAGALQVDPGMVSGWYHYGGWKPRFPTDIDVVLCSRPLIEWHLRRRVEALPNVRFRHETTAEELLTDPGKTRVTGVRITGAAGEETLSADLVLDASGRGTRAPRWLEALGYGHPEHEEVKIDLAYTSRLYERPADFRGDWRFLAVYSSPPARRCGLALEIEENRWIVSLNGYFKDHPPADDEGFLAFARSLPVPDLYEAIKDAKPLGPASTHKVPSSRWIHYEKMARFPDRLILIGDSVCSLNPIYGQGMTVTFLCAQALAASLEATGANLGGLAREVQRKVAGLVADPWMLSTTMDLRFPEAEGKRLPGLTAVQWAFANLIDLTSVDPRACRLFYEILHMRRGTAALLRPDMLFPFLAYSAKSLFVPQPERVTRAMPPAPPA